MELQQVRYFLALAKSLNFTRAAEQCNVTQPALTKAIQKLELELGGPLIYRERNLTQLTQLGQLVLPMFERVLGAAEAALQHASEYGKKAIAPLNVGLGPGVSANIVAAPLMEVAKSIPGLSVEIIDAQFDEISSSLLDGNIDAGIVGDPNPASNDRFDRWHLFEEHFVVLMPSDHPLAMLDVIPQNRLAEVLWLDCGGCDVTRLAWERWKGPQMKSAIAHHAMQVFQLLPLVASGMGLLLAPENMPLISGVVAKPIDDLQLRRTVFLIAMAGRRHPPALEAFIGIMRARDWARDLDVLKALASEDREKVAETA